MAIGNLLNSQQKIDFAKARIIPPASPASILEIVTLQCLFAEYEAEVSKKRGREISSFSLTSRLIFSS
jgi:hypothetical protein